ncbi:Autophagy-related 13 [Lecanosticta acicola]|uniref:Autophagy-related protein 13 n=1 Tax=Lecanosticta acicola TaxID=111012 RepID=A0AAI9E8P9_9PEZI|nr:Autophagy-related 13 [Lecanosticta acicola]
MHQHLRPSPRSASAASNPSTNPERTNNSRDRPPQRTRSSVDLASYTERAAVETASDSVRQTGASSGEDREATKLNQIIQHFHSKAALTICSSRANLPQVSTRNGDIKQNRWFNVILDDTDVLAEDLSPWRRPDLSENKPPPLMIEVYLDTSHLSHNQALVVVDETGKRYDVADALPSSSDSSPRSTRNGGRYCEVVLERWTIELGDAEDCSSSELNDALPNVYKKGVVLFRALYSFARFLPAWKLHRKLTRQSGAHQAMRLRFRIRAGHNLTHGRHDSLYAPLCPSEQRGASVVERYRVPPLLCPAGPLSIAVDYRTNCDFNVADSEALLSSRFLGLDEGTPVLAAGRSLPGARSEQSRVQYSSLAGAVGEQRPRTGAYGSLGTFHAAEKRASPVTELRRRALDMDSDESDTERDKVKGKMKAADSLSRRSSTKLVANPPFKGGSLASSPRASPSPSTSAPRSDSSFAKLAGTSSGKRVSLNTLPQQALRAPPIPIPSETAIASSGSSSPKPAPVHRYSSSFANRSKRFTPSSKTGESNTSSGRASHSSKERSEEKWMAPSSRGANEDLLQGTSDQPGLSRQASGSLPGPATEDNAIFGFIQELEKAKDRTLRSRPASRDNTVNLSKYSSMKDPGAQLADEMSASSLIQTSSTPPSRRLSNVPGLSTSSSPSRAQTYAPHVRSRLSTHSVAEEISGASGASGEGLDSPKIREEEEHEDQEEDEEPFIFPQDNV